MIYFNCTASLFDVHNPVFLLKLFWTFGPMSEMSYVLRVQPGHMGPFNKYRLECLEGG